jgi:SprT-like family
MTFNLCDASIGSTIDAAKRDIKPWPERGKLFPLHIDEPVRTSQLGVRMRRKTKWNARRLQRLFERYNCTYFRRKLRGCSAVISSLPHGQLGVYMLSKRVIAIDVRKQTSDRELRGTVLHEMAHAAAHSRGSRGHDLKFFAELERLLRLGAPVTVDNAEAGYVRILRDVVPPRFRLLKQKMERAEARRRKILKDYATVRNLELRRATDDQIVGYFESYGYFTWREALVKIGPEVGLTDEVGRVVSSWARRVLAQAKRTHSRARRLHREYERIYSAVRLGLAISPSERRVLARVRRTLSRGWRLPLEYEKLSGPRTTK